MPMDVRNLFDDVAANGSEERFTTLAEGHGVRIERIVSTGQASPPGFWYEQPWDEWVLVLSGRAVLGFEAGQPCPLGPGDCVLIPAGRRHRVEWTDPAAPTVWLAVHYGLPPPHDASGGPSRS